MSLVAGSCHSHQHASPPATHRYESKVRYGGQPNVSHARGHLLLVTQTDHAAVQYHMILTMGMVCVPPRLM